MAKYRFRGVLNAAQFPLIAMLQGRTVIQPTYDPGVKVPRSFYGTDESADYTVPQIAYCQNVLPTAEGVQSIGFAGLVPAFSTPVTDFDQVFTLRDPDENNTLYCPGGGKNYILDASTLTWVSTDPISAVGIQVSRAYVNGHTYVCFAGMGLYEYNVVADTFLPVTVTYPPGVVEADVQCIGASNNYLLLGAGLTVCWSSLIDPLDFTPSLTTGAGFATPQDVKANITVLQGTAGGFLIFTHKNAVAAGYTNNVRAPFAFKEVANCGGVESAEQLTNEQSSGPIYAWTTNGLQKVTLQTSEFVSGEINDFIGGRVYDSYDPGTGVITTTNYAGTEFKVKVALIASRWLVISYSTLATETTQQFDWSLVYDTVLKRNGRTRINHTDCFSFSLSYIFGALSYDDFGTDTYDDIVGSYDDLVLSGTGEAPPTSKRSFAYLQRDGQVKIVEMDYQKGQNQAGIVIFGKFQLVRANLMTHQQCTFEGTYLPAFTAKVIRSLDGYTQLPAEAMTVVPVVGQVATLKNVKYGGRFTGLNFSLAITGAFALSSYLLEVVQDGDC